MANLIYTTTKGDTFDIIALDAYNDEFMAHHIISANLQYSNCVVFDADLKLVIPIIDEPKQATLPPWQD